MAPIHRLIVVRHGETEWSQSGRHTGKTDIPLTDNGIAQSTALKDPLDALHLVKPLVWSSPRQRAQQTAHYADLPISETSEDLAEWDYGDYEGLTKPEIFQRQPGWNIWRDGTPGGESPSHMQQRVDSVVERATSAMNDSDVVIIAHGHFCRVLLARFISEPMSVGQHLAMLPASFAVCVYDVENPQIRNLGVTGYDNAGYKDAGRRH